jgi:hypothetical protein
MKELRRIMRVLNWVMVINKAKSRFLQYNNFKIYDSVRGRKRRGAAEQREKAAAASTFSLCRPAHHGPACNIHARENLYWGNVLVQVHVS